MKEIKDTHLLNTYLNQYKILDIFDNPDLPFRLYSYEPGEIMNYTHPLENYLKFIVCGEISLYSIQEDGEQFIAYQGEFCGLIGDLEFCGLESDNRYQEALTTVYSIELPLSEVRQKLLNDNRFLRYLLYFITKRHNNGLKKDTDMEISLIKHSIAMKKRSVKYVSLYWNTQDSSIMFHARNSPWSN